MPRAVTWWGENWVRFMVETLNDLTRASYPHLIALRPKDGVSLALPACESTADGQSLASESDPCCCNVLEWGGGVPPRPGVLRLHLSPAQATAVSPSTQPL